MDKNQLVFSSDCAINFDDLGEFKDYTEDIETMLHNLTQFKQNPSINLHEQLLKEILKADPQDTFHAPAFKDLISVILEIIIWRKDYFKSKISIFKLIFHNLMQILEESFVSYQFSEDIGPKICQYLIESGKKNEFSEFERMSLLVCISKLTKRLSYIDDLENYCNILYHCIDEKSIISTEQVGQQGKKMMVQVYSEVIQLATRNRKVRQLLAKKLQSHSVLPSEHLLLGYKINLWRKDKRILMYLSQIEASELKKYQVFQQILRSK